MSARLLTIMDVLHFLTSQCYQTRSARLHMQMILLRCFTLLTKWVWHALGGHLWFPGRSSRGFGPSHGHGAHACGWGCEVCVLSARLLSILSFYLSLHAQSFSTSTRLFSSIYRISFDHFFFLKTLADVKSLTTFSYLLDRRFQIALFVMDIKAGI